MQKEDKPERSPTRWQHVEKILLVMSTTAAFIASITSIGPSTLLGSSIYVTVGGLAAAAAVAIWLYSRSR